MKLKQLLKGLPLAVRGSKEVEITSLTADSRTAAPGSLFFAQQGATHDGASFIPQALQAGASAILTAVYDPFCPATQIIAPRPSEWQAPLAARFYAFPSRSLYIAAVTGTKGKTTSTYLLHHILQALRGPAGFISTVETLAGERRFPSSLTTPFPIHNHKWLREMALSGSKSAAIEVSSHALDQGRIDEIELNAALFTNLTPDHLDYHKNMEAYAAAKRRLFEKLASSPKQERCALYNADSPYGKWMAAPAAGLPTLSFGLDKGDLRATDVQLIGGTRFTASYQGESALFYSPLMGRFNIYNLLGALALGLALGAPLSSLVEPLASFAAVPGRLEKVGDGKGPQVFVDYAHEGQSLASVLQTLRETCRGKLICVFGCGGERDPLRRQGMGQAAERFADRIVVTSDNPRREDPLAIIRDILTALKTPSYALVEPDRKRAIQAAIQMASPDDTVLIAGKGHEKVQLFHGQTLPFDDVEEAKIALQNRR
jgi:UDP-N-acetylmuramoyl-L-alanyl-D-glutamate--2,6-diaminopimelate ligase